MNDAPSTTLQQIIDYKRREVEKRKLDFTINDFRQRIRELGRPRNFFSAVTRHDPLHPTAVIAEIKRKSPSAGWIRPEYADDSFDPVPIARAYHANGAAAISCLTDERFFAGRVEYIHAIRDVVPLPVLRKDFIVDPWQVWESRANGADAILLIAESLTESQLVDLMILATELQLTTLVECHDIENLLKVRPHVGFPKRSYGLLGINNRNLQTMETDVSHTLRLVDMVDDPKVLVSESGIREPADLLRLRNADVRIVLVGESLMRREDPGTALASLLSPNGSMH